jgi:hypothetical protein
MSFKERTMQQETPLNKMKICTMNICGVNNKTEELVKEIKKRKIPILGLAHTRTKGQGCKKILYTLIYMQE